MVTMRQLTTYITIYIVLNVIFNLTQGAPCARVHYVILRGTLSKTFIKLDTHLRRHPDEVSCGTSALQGVNALIYYITVRGKGRSECIQGSLTINKQIYIII